MSKEPTAASPAASGPAGSQFEGEIGAHYLLSMLVGAEPRGLPGTIIERVEFQRAPEGYPLDDVVVRARDPHGEVAELQVQVKRTMTFAPGDPVFRDVVGQIAKAATSDSFWQGRHELAIATAKTSRKIEGAYQDVLSWARRLGSAEVFFRRLERKGSANDDMRTFVETFREHLGQFGGPNDDKAVWRLLGRLWILTFDFTAEGSASKDLAKERAIRALHPEEADRAEALWSALIEAAIRIASVAGDIDRPTLRADIASLSFRLAGQRRFATARAAIAESSHNSLADIGDRIGNISIGRIDRLAELRSALDQSGYVEIRGDAGVGKSGLLKHIAEQVATEAAILVLSPGRVTPRGWSAMRTALGFDGVARELLSDMAGDGGATIFIDNLDRFTRDESRTVIDLVRAASEVPGVSVLATARRSFGSEEPSWLPEEALNRLGRAEPIEIAELSDAEIEELRAAAPQLAYLLADGHPARDVTRNLYRLSRLASRRADEPAPRSEVDMAFQWWKTADGKSEGLRLRARVLRALALQVLTDTSEPLDVRDCPPSAVDDLIASETLRDFGNDRVAFRHDVLREWAIANLLAAEPSQFGQLALSRPASAIHARAIELCSRMAIEDSAESTAWESLLNRLSQSHIHGSWRRSVLLALVRSEIARDVLTRAESPLLADKAALLRELIHTMMAVDATSAAQYFAALGLDPARVPATINVPSGPSWSRLIKWLLELDTRLPQAAIPDVVDLYVAWCTAMVGMDPITPTILRRMFDWLVEVESARHNLTLGERRQAFGGEVPYSNLPSLEAQLRAGFLSFCYRTPELAKKYLTAKERSRNRVIVESILKFRGSLAQAAPTELADLTAANLIRQQKFKRRRFEHEIGDGPFEFLDRSFLPDSPAQGPFLELLTHAPVQGLRLIRQLIDHAIAFHSRGEPPGDNSIVITLEGGDRTFPWINTYNWSRSASCNYQCVTSSLMALEAWAHNRIENGGQFDRVLSDVMGEPNAPAAYLLVVVDLLLSHWPKSRDWAVPFLASAKLLCIDRMRQVNDNIEFPDIFGLKQFEREPAGLATLNSLQQRPSRRLVLDTMLAHYAFAPSEAKERLVTLLRQQAVRLGEPDPKADMSDPAMMARYSLNVVDPNNWKDIELTTSDGTATKAKQYVPPEVEARHLSAIQAERAERFAEVNLEARIDLAIDDRSKSSPEFAREAVEWARRQPATPEHEYADLRRYRIASTAMIAMRDGDQALRSESRPWCQDVFAWALGDKEDPVHRSRDGIRFNPPALAFAGIVYGLKDGISIQDRRTLLDTAARSDPAAARGLSVCAKELEQIDGRLLRSLLRSAFAGSIKIRRPASDAPEGQALANAKLYRERCEAAVNAELAWLAGVAAEPGWPDFLTEVVGRPKRSVSLPGQRRRQVHSNPDHDEYTDHQAAALWLTSCQALFDAAKRPWVIEIVKAYSEWTARSNGVGISGRDEVSTRLTEWNAAYFGLVARCLPAMARPAIDELVLGPIFPLADSSFLRVVEIFLPEIDRVFFTAAGLAPDEAVRIRSTLAERMMATEEWHRLIGSAETSIGMHVGPAVAAVFFNSHGFIQPAKAYLYPQSIDQIPPFLPLFERLANNAPSLFVAVVLLNLLEVSPRIEHAATLVVALRAWVAAFPDNNDFWIDQRIGLRACALLNTTLVASKALFGTFANLRSDVDSILAALVRVGVAEAVRLERTIAAEQ